MKKRLLSVLCIILALGIAEQVYSQEKKDSDQISNDSNPSKKEVKNRNVMLNAESSTSPRSVNIRLPFKGDILILENDVPVVYWFWPTMPTLAWRYDNSLSEMGLLSFSESALTFGKVGYTVTSSTRKASRKFKGYATIYGNSLGTSRYDMTLTGPMGKKGWGYTVSAYQNWDKGNGQKRMFTEWNEQATMFKFGIQKKYDKGNIRLLYKYGESKAVMSNYQPLNYDGGGETSSLDNFELGKDSYAVRNGLAPYLDAYSGEPKQIHLGSDDALLATTHNFYLTGEHKFNNGWKLDYSSMYQKSKAPVAIQVPISIMLQEPDQQGSESYYYQGTNNLHEGDVQYVLNMLIPRSQSDVNTIITRAELTKRVDNHALRLGVTQVYNHTKFVSQNGMYVQTVEANPEKLDLRYGDYQMTDEYGGLPLAFAGYGNTFDVTDNKLALYLSDDVKVSNWFRFGVGGRVEYQTKKEIRNIYKNELIEDKPLAEHTYTGIWNTVGTADFVLNITPSFGLLGDVTYNNFFDNETSWNYPYRDVNGNPIGEPGTSDPARQSVPEENKITVVNYGGGIFLNAGKKLSLVSKVTRITKENILSNSAVITNPDGSGERKDFSPFFYDISTVGWSTDVVLTPFKGFVLHYLLTLQNPQYKNYNYGAFGVNYNYSNNTIPELSKVLMEIDPSYSFMKGDMRVWFSLRYFGKQYANPTNQYSYNGRWENFGGIDYRISRKAMLKFQVVNFMDEKGVKGQMQGADQVTDDRFVGRKVVAGAIRPRTFELSLNIKF
ncbi:MAG: hypothetical protein JKX79_00150 [Labilibaculum sp.]|nr:hypothetical protein [Labilibaculum sp.]